MAPENWLDGCKSAILCGGLNIPNSSYCLLATAYCLLATAYCLLHSCIVYLVS